ncbi:MAG TPA: hypothetical protein VF017_11470 [Thermoanaerobaculia bacterium]|nr:hypothetical protein [Thermoanaerobaculia bacterium]
MTPRSSFFAGEGQMLKLLLWAISVLFIAIMVVTWVLAERAKPVLLDLETGRPVAERPKL